VEVLLPQAGLPATGATQLLRKVPGTLRGQLRPQPEEGELVSQVQGLRFPGVRPDQERVASSPRRQQLYCCPLPLAPARIARAHSLACPSSPPRLSLWR
jgi:hypothetical protein